MVGVATGWIFDPPMDTIPTPFSFRFGTNGILSKSSKSSFKVDNVDGPNVIFKENCSLSAVSMYVFSGFCKDTIKLIFASRPNKQIRLKCAQNSLTKGLLMSLADNDANSSINTKMGLSGYDLDVLMRFQTYLLVART